MALQPEVGFHLDQGPDSIYGSAGVPHNFGFPAAYLWDDGLPRFFDPRAGLIRHGTRQPAHVGDLEMTWQNLFFHENTVRAAMAAPAGWCNPAVEGRFLMATDGLRELARRAGDVFPQWFDPYTKEAAVQNDVKALGRVREPWQAEPMRC